MDLLLGAGQNTIIDKMLEDLKIEKKDLYPVGEKITLITTRNNLFHSSVNPDYDLLIKEDMRLDALVGRILLRTLDWDDISKSPNRFILEWLADFR